MRRTPETAPRRLEHALIRAGFCRIAGVDEAGRGCLAGPVVAAAVILPPDTSLSGITDSKRLRPRERDAALVAVQEAALSVGIGMCSPGEIDRLNILWASLEAMRRAVASLAPRPDFLLVDGNRCFDAPPVPARPIVKGDRRSLSIAAASIVAKVTRDRLMAELHAAHPEYGLDRHKGYPTADHYEALRRYGPTPFHRFSFRLNRPSEGQSG